MLQRATGILFAFYSVLLACTLRALSVRSKLLQLEFKVLLSLPAPHRCLALPAAAKGTHMGLLGDGKQHALGMLGQEMASGTFSTPWFTFYTKAC